MNIKKVDDKPMVIHTKEKAKLHVKGATEFALYMLEQLLKGQDAYFQS